MQIVSNEVNSRNRSQKIIHFKIILWINRLWRDSLTYLVSFSPFTSFKHFCFVCCSEKQKNLIVRIWRIQWQLLYQQLSIWRVSKLNNIFLDCSSMIRLSKNPWIPPLISMTSFINCSFFITRVKYRFEVFIRLLSGRLSQWRK